MWRLVSENLDVLASAAPYAAGSHLPQYLAQLHRKTHQTIKKVTEDIVYSIASHAKPKEISSLLEHCRKADFPSARKQLLTVMLEYGLSGLDVVMQLQVAIWQLEHVTDRQKLEMVKVCGEAEFRMTEGSDEYIQLEALLANFMLQLQKS